MSSENGMDALGISALAVLSVLGIIGNIVVVIVILRRFKLESWTYLLVCHLALCDLLTCAIVGPFWIAAYKIKNLTVCKSSIFVTCVLILCSSWTLVLIACERYIFIKYPLRCSLIITTKRFITSICALWSVSVFVAFLTTTVALSTPKTHQCLATLIVNRWITMIFFAIFTLLPIIFMLFAYTYILRAALRQQRKIEDIRSASEKRAKLEKIRKELRTSLMLYAVVISYFVCTFPYSLVNLLDAINPNIIGSARAKAYNISILWFMNAVLNPVLYALTNKEVRKELSRALHSRRRIDLSASRSNVAPATEG